ncbi:PhaM family polyhydroxyalkanoate granule multifunctional regulatory protein [Schlegelella aquatica]|uniref:PhaM family polyhydroxyalkanoate granule multifunctional regulatory protein n=1 Tax=Caldimonas aquatica TaxID=376175 RepID=UPI0037532714
MTDPSSMLSRMMPGFDFLQRLGGQAQEAMPAFSQWVAPTLDPQELDKRIADLRAVQFWLEQNAKMVAATVQAMEVQRMTLAALQTMNVPLESMKDALLARPAPAQAAGAAPAAAAAPASAAQPPAAEASAGSAAPVGALPVVDPIQWWGALTQQFAQLAGNALKEVGASAATPAASGTGGGSPEAGAAGDGGSRSPSRPRRAATKRPPGAR